MLSVLVLLTGTLYQFVLRHFVVNTLGVGRPMQPLSDFPYKCRRISHPKLQACEDMWIDGDGHALYAACSSPSDRAKWMVA